MQLKKDTDVLTTDGEKIGSLDRVAIDPVTKDITHLIVKEGFLFPKDKVLPIELVQRATEKEITLKVAKDHMPELPNFEETRYIPLEETEEMAYSVEDEAPQFYWYPPVSVSQPWPAYASSHQYLLTTPEPPYVVETDQNIPPETVALEEGAEVIDTEDEHIGDVEQIFTHSETGRATHILVSEGLLFKEKTLIPTTWIHSIGEDKVRLNVNAGLLNRLPPYVEEG